MGLGIMLILGGFIFSLNTAAFDQRQRSTQQRWSSHDRLGQRAMHQYLGPGSDEITLPGIIYPSFKSQVFSLEILRQMADNGEPYIMLDGMGFVHGDWIILGVEETRSHFMDNGAAQKIEFNIKLRKYSDENNLLETIIDAIPL